VILGAGRREPLRKRTISVFPNLTLDKFLIFRNVTAMQYFVVMIDYGRRGREAIVDPEVTRREVVSRVASGEYKNISFIHEIADGAVEETSPPISWPRPPCLRLRLPVPVCRRIASITREICESMKWCDGICRCVIPANAETHTPRVLVSAVW
jgi:hypothetical protein